MDCEVLGWSGGCDVMNSSKTI